MNLFDIVAKELFKPLTSKYKETYIACLMLIYNTYRTEMSFGVDREVIVSKLEQFFEAQADGGNSTMVFDEDEEVANDARSKAVGILRRLKDSGWVEYEQGADYKIRVNLFGYATTLLETFQKLILNEEMEYQSLVSQIHGTLFNQEAYVKPYEYIIKRVAQNTEELMIGLKQLNTNIKKYIDAITNEKSANEIVEDFFLYHKDIGSKAYHRIKTSDNISYFRAAILDKLYELLNQELIFQKAVQGYMEIEQEPSEEEARIKLTVLIQQIINAFRNYDAIIQEIDDKNSKYMSSAVARAKFLLTNTNNAEGKIARILGYLAEELNQNEEIGLNDDADEALMQIFSIFPQAYLDSESLYVLPINKKIGAPEELETLLGMSEEERSLRKEAQKERDQNRFSRKNINHYVAALLKQSQGKPIMASDLKPESKRELIRLVFISLYGRDHKSIYRVISTDTWICYGDFRFADFRIEGKSNGNI